MGRGAVWVLFGLAALPGCLIEVPDLRSGPSPDALGVSVSAPDGRVYRIDRTEVTNAAYAAWLDGLGGKIPTQPAVCKANTDLVPRSGWPVAKDLQDHPVTFVDWCDAATYCTDHGKRLCGGVGGGAYDPDRATNAAESEWFNACSSGGKQSFPYGPEFDGKACNGAGYGLLASMPVLEPASCEGGFPGVFGMNGNAREWDDACVADGPAADCLVRGGAFKSNPPDDPAGGDLGCDIAWTFGRSDANELTGFRCCTDP